jgi:hypothetical protein
MRMAYVKPSAGRDGRAVAVYEMSADEVRTHLAALRQIALRLERFLAVSSDPAELAGLLVPDYDAFWWNHPITLGKMLRAGTITEEMHDAAKDFQASFIVANLDPIRALPMLRVPGTGREPHLSERQLDARRRVHDALAALGGLSSPAGSCVWHVVGLQRSIREWAIRQGWGGRAVEQTEARGMLVAALGVLAAHLGYGAAKRAS